MNNNDFPMVTIDGEILDKGAIEYEFERLVSLYAQHIPQEQLQKQLPQLRTQAVHQAIGARLLFQEAAKLDIQVDEKDVDKSIDAMSRQVGSLDKLREILKKQNLTEDKLREQIRRGRKVDLLVEQICSQTPEPTEEEMKAHFEDHEHEYMQAERVLCQHILISPKAPTPECEAEAKAKIKEIRTRILAGSNFADEAAKYSDCPSGKSNGGSLGWFSHGQMVPEFDKAAFEMKVGDVSDIIKTQFGYHIIYKTDHKPPQTPRYEDIKDKVREFLHHAKRGETLANHVNELKSRVNIQIN